MNEERQEVQSQITFLYYRDMDGAVDFYEQTMRLSSVIDVGWAKIYKVSGNAYIGLVGGDRGYHQAQEESAVLITFVVDDSLWWHKYLTERGVEGLTNLDTINDIKVRIFFLRDPGGYAIEIQEFLDPQVAKMFS